MTARRVSLARAGADIAFAVAALLCGLLGAPWWSAGLVALVMVVYWVWTRRSALSRLSGGNLLVQSAVAITILLLVLAGSYWFGLAVRGLSS